MDRGDIEAPLGRTLSDAERGVACFKRLRDWLEADALAHPEPTDEGRTGVEISAMVLLLCEMLANDATDPDDAMKYAAVIGHQLMQGVARAWNARVARARAH